MEQNLLIRDGFQPGMLMEVLSESGEQLFSGRIKSMDEDGTVTLVDANGAPLPPAMGAAPVRLRGRAARDRMAAYSGTRRLSSRIFWKIDQLEGGVIQNRREFYRQPVSLEALVMLIGRCDGTEEFSEIPAECTILDISGGGIRMSCEERFAVGDHLLVAEVLLMAGQPSFDFGCVVRRVEEGQEGFVYGCQFEGMSEREQGELLNVINLLQKRNVQ